MDRIEELEKQVVELTAALTAKDDEVVGLRIALNDSENTIAYLKSEAQQVSELTAALAAKDEEIVELRLALNDREIIIADLKDEMQRRPQNTRTEEMHATIIRLTVSGYRPKEIQQMLGNIDLSVVYAAAKVKNDRDKKRILGLYAKYPTQFGGISKEKLVAWLNKVSPNRLAF